MAVPELTDLNRYRRALEAAENRGAGLRGGVDRFLTFESGIETDFLEYRHVENLPLLRLGLILAVAFYVLFFWIDYAVWHRYQQWWCLVPILYISSAANLAMLGLSYVKRLLPLMGWLGALTVLINACSLSFASAYSYRQGLSFPPEAAVIQLVYTLFLLNLPFRFSAPVAVTTVGMFMLLHSMSDLLSSDFFYRSFMMAAAGIMGTLAGYLTERMQRLAWLRSRLLRELSEHDSLTGLYNHRVFYQRGEQLLKQARRDKVDIAVLVCDVDHFKQFNDGHGHLAGDEALRHVAAALSQAARRPLDLAARLGGEEFGLLLYNVPPSMAEMRAEEVRNVIRGLSLSGNRRVTISIGVATLGTNNLRPIEALIGAADAALYRAKAEGRDRVVAAAAT